MYQKTVLGMRALEVEMKQKEKEETRKPRHLRRGLSITLSVIIDGAD